MVDVKTETKTNQNSKPVNPRTAIREARQRRLHVIKGDKAAATVNVFAANEDVRETLRHGNGTRFRDTIDQGVEWPNDSFTKRRIREGSVRTDGPGSGDQAPDDESLNPRQQAAARYGSEAKETSEPKETNGKSKPQPQAQPPQPAA
jgi:hypothetical protein